MAGDGKPGAEMCHGVTEWTELSSRGEVPSELTERSHNCEREEGEASVCVCVMQLMRTKSR